MKTHANKNRIKAGSIALCLSMLGSPAYATDTERYIVKFKPGKASAVSSLVAQNGGNVANNLPNHDAISIELPVQALNAFERNPNIEYVEVDEKRYLLSQTSPYGISMVQADLVDDSLSGSQKVCIIDSGYQLAHEDLSSNLVSGTNDTGTGNWYEDENSHGTHVAGTIAAFNNGVGVVGVAPNGNLPLHIVKVFDADGWAYSSSLVSALDVCTANGASVVNMSLGGTRASRFERVAFQNAYDNGVLSIAAAGNDGNTRHSYPASYDSVVSVAAIDSTKQIASFSQQTDQVELSAPGVGVLSSVPMGSGRESAFSVASNNYASASMDGSPVSSATGTLVNCGIGDTTCDNASGNVCLIERGSISFSDKVLNCEAGGGVAAVIYNNESGMLYGTLGGVSTGIPSIGISQSDGAALVALTGSSSTVTVSATNYAHFDGTSMATPHVAGVAALVWSHHENCSNGEVRSALQATAEDLGSAGRDNAYGYGLVQTLDAINYLNAQGCTGSDSGSGDGGNTGGGNEKCKGGPKRCP